ncbi:peptidyl-tRNA hydrolase [Bacteroidia bacterium]|nr:peptidyl-tRNA hydrolase [Bacteroidia bacterium]
MKYLIAGLGNIGAEYENTRHNVGFMALDIFAQTNDIVFTLGRHAFVAEKRLRGNQIVLIKPTTYMNLSGKAINYWLQKENIDLQNLLVIVDDLALDTGKLRMKKSGSAGGHNGLINIIETLKTDNFCRLRIGIDSNFSVGHQVNYVLNKFKSEELTILEEKLPVTTEIINSFVLQGADKTMNLYNNK